jgi:nicotinamide mononucleotide transporter
MLAVTAAYEAAAAHVAPDYSFNAYEFVGTWSGLICVWLSRTRNIQCWPWGIVSSVAFGFFFADIGLPGQEWLNLVYFTLVQVWSWPYWAFGGEARTELPVTTQSWTMRLVTVAAIVAGTALTYKLIGVFSPGSFHPILDSIVTASSVIAQYLLGRKQVESWILWLGPVNLLSVILFFEAGAYTVTALYVAYFVHALFALRSWKDAKKETALVEPVAHG